VVGSGWWGGVHSRREEMPIHGAANPLVVICDGEVLDRRANSEPSACDDLPVGTRRRMNDRLLGIYMTDHLALGMFALELARRAQRAHADTALGTALARVAEEGIARDISFYKQMMRRLGLSCRSPKIALAIAGERLGRAKLNGRLRRRSPLSSFEELDFVTMAIENKVVLWENLRDLAGLRERLPDVNFEQLIARARAQRSQLEPFRLQAGRSALAGATQEPYLKSTSAAA
jgi:hypothetical protein